MSSKQISGACPPSWMLWLWPILDRLLSGVIGIRPVNPDGGLLGISHGYHRGHQRILSDGTVVTAGSRLLEVHILNRNLSRIAGTLSRGLTAWDIAGQMSKELSALAGEVQADSGIKALHGTTLLVAGLRRLGFSVEEIPPGPLFTVVSFYLRGLMLAYYASGREIPMEKVRALGAKELWMSRRQFLARHGGGASDIGSR